MPQKGKLDLVKERFWRSAVERFRSSRKTRKQFCLDEGLSTDLLIYWSRVIGERDAEMIQGEAVPEIFVLITVSQRESHNGLPTHVVAEVRRPDFSLLLFNGIDARTFKAIVQALREV